ncbi:YtxH domain-containing protein [Aureibacillus halotolerans]|uniref:Gas vesicle protein n=1 Tax=Aureibacillus halotolerans TaxID=1508390 RepID=A0A4R6TYW5_9BACI|nr:YtxH domain-containing protein [Aureibacillus halotolerans]TDQ35425.1 hypothetical protein EV213_12143 [Aureibacillus halotolerans]
MSFSNKQKVFVGIVVGGAAGLAFALKEQQTRKHFVDNTNRMKNSTMQLLHEVRANPSHYSEQFRQSLTELSELVRNSTSDVKEAVAKLSDAKEHTLRAASIVKDTGSDLRQVGQSLQEGTKELKEDIETTHNGKPTPKIEAVREPAPL